MPPPYPTWVPGDYQPNMRNDYEGVTRWRDLGFGATAQVGLIFLIVVAFCWKDALDYTFFSLFETSSQETKVISSKTDDNVWSCAAIKCELNNTT